MSRYKKKALWYNQELIIVVLTTIINSWYNVMNFNILVWKQITLPAVSWNYCDSNPTTVWTSVNIGCFDQPKYQKFNLHNLIDVDIGTVICTKFTLPNYNQIWIYPLGTCVHICMISWWRTDMVSKNSTESTRGLFMEGKSIAYTKQENEINTACLSQNPYNACTTNDT